MRGLRSVVMLGCLLAASLAACAPPEVPEYRRARGPVRLDLSPDPEPAGNAELPADDVLMAKAALEDGRETTPSAGEDRGVITRRVAAPSLLPGGTTTPSAPPPAEAPSPLVVVARDDANELRAIRPSDESMQRTKGPMQMTKGLSRGPRTAPAAEAPASEEERLMERGERGQASPEVLQVLRGQRNALQRCYDALVLRVPATTEGNVTVRFTLSPAGEVQAADVIGGTLEDADFQRCVVGRLQSLTFPRADSAAVFTYPFRFGGGPALGAGGE